jgi:hypothetical protein
VGNWRQKDKDRTTLEFYGKVVGVGIVTGHQDTCPLRSCKATAPAFFFDSNGPSGRVRATRELPGAVTQVGEVATSSGRDATVKIESTINTLLGT